MANDYSNSDNDNAQLLGGNRSRGNSMATDNTPKTINQDSKSQFVFNLPFIYFCAAIVVTFLIGFVYMGDNSIGYIISGVFGLLVCGFGIKQFHTLLALRQKINEYTSLNTRFAGEKKLIKRDLGLLIAANSNLSTSQQRIEAANEVIHANLVAFRGIQENMENYNLQSIAETKKIQKKVKFLNSKWHDNTLNYERGLIHTVFERTKRRTHHLGMTKDEFDNFISHLPMDYQQRFKRLGSYEKLCGNGNCLMYDDMAKCLDLFARMAAEDIDIEFELVPTETPRQATMRLVRTPRGIMPSNSPNSNVPIMKDSKKFSFSSFGANLLSPNSNNNNNSNASFDEEDTNRLFTKHKSKLTTWCIQDEDSLFLDMVMERGQSQHAPKIDVSIVNDSDLKIDDNVWGYEREIRIRRETKPGYHLNAKGEEEMVSNYVHLKNIDGSKALHLVENVQTVDDFTSELHRLEKMETSRIDDIIDHADFNDSHINEWLRSQQ